MRTAIISDVHNNLTALEAVLADLRTTSPDMVVHGGDLAANGSSPAEVIDIIRELKWPGVCGNTDEMLGRPESFEELASVAPERHGLRRTLFKCIAPVTRGAIGPERLKWLESLPTQWSLEDISVVHATPTNLWRAPLANASDTELMNAYVTLNTRVVVYGHIHCAYVRRVHSATSANAGSVSLSYDGDPRASYLVVDDHEAIVRRVSYDVAREAKRLADLGYPCADWLATILRTGRYMPPPQFNDAADTGA